MTQLRIQYNQIADLGVEYTLRATIEQTTSQPDVLDNCLVVKKGDSGTDEELMRVGAFSEVVTTPLDTLPATVNLFYAPSLALIVGGIQAGDDIIILTSPFVWKQHFGAGVTFQTKVDNPAVGPNLVSVITPFPAFGRNLEFIVERASVVILPVSWLPPCTRSWMRCHRKIFLLWLTQ